MPFNPTRKLRLSIQPQLIDKTRPLTNCFFTQGWLNQELTISEFVDFLKRGYAYCAQLSGSRKANNFLASDIVSVDIDHGMTIEQALQHPVV